MTDGRNSGRWGARRTLVAILGLTAGSGLLFLSNANSQQRVPVIQPQEPPRQPVSVSFQASSGCTTHSCIPSNFQASTIRQGNSIWFDANLVVQGISGTSATTVFVRNQTVTWSDS